MLAVNNRVEFILVLTNGAGMRGKAGCWVCWGLLSGRVVGWGEPGCPATPGQGGDRVSQQHNGHETRIQICGLPGLLRQGERAEPTERASGAGGDSTDGCPSGQLFTPSLIS